MTQSFILAALVEAANSAPQLSSTPTGPAFVGVVYADALGRTIASTSQYVEGTTDPVFGSLSTYDVAGRVTLSEQAIGLVISINGDND